MPTFFRTLLEFSKLLNTSPTINHLIQDACGACGNAAVACLGSNLKILMCLFHVQKNVKEYLKNKDEKIKVEIVKDLNFLHFSRNKIEFTLSKSSIYKKWDENGLSEFRAY